MWALAQLLLAPLGVATGRLLSHIIDDETLMYGYWFLLFGLFGLLGSVFFAHTLWLAVVSFVLAAYALKTLQGWLLGLSIGGLLVSLLPVGAYLVLVSLLPVCAYFVHHEQSRNLWLVAVLPTLISAVWFLW